jgi:hypothetical protein
MRDPAVRRKIMGLIQVLERPMKTDELARIIFPGDKLNPARNKIRQSAAHAIKEGYMLKIGPATWDIKR